MKKFIIKDVEKYMVYFYDVEASSKDEALDKYCDELAGKINPIHDYYNPDEEDGVSVMTLKEYERR